MGSVRSIIPFLNSAPHPAPAAGPAQQRRQNPSEDLNMDLYDITDEEITEAKAIILAEASDEGINDPDWDL